MTDQTQAAPAPKRGGFTPESLAKAAATRAANAAKRKAKPLSKKFVNEFAGMTKLACADGCNVDRCVVSGVGYCAHPLKGGLQAKQMHDTKALARLARAKDHLGGR